MKWGWVFAIVLAGASAWAQDPGRNPADMQKKNDGEQDKKKEGTHTFDVVGTRVSDLKEEDLIGPNRQPRWTAQRRFPATRVYVIPEGEIEFEWWARVTYPHQGGPEEVRYLWELEMGLPYHFQVDLYLGMENTGSANGTFDLTRQQVEVRWSPADWGVIPGNPTLYAEYVNKKAESDAAEFKVLFGGQLAPRWHWGVNGVLERTLHDTLDNEWQITGGVSYSVVDMVLSLGVEAQAIWIDKVGARGTYEETYFVGPSIQVRPLPNMHVDVVVFGGFGKDSPDARTFIVVGWEF